ncbi:hypothetical protein M5K25_005417 [Dendrobium thyrsiflorum]|uniref:Dof-type domain-containing protein n=1 Tax=Dendrobium thyrsiflorum TaxID=117978 RepID=A0ABD0VPX9_DENTH
MADLDMESSGDSPVFKLFGAVIVGAEDEGRLKKSSSAPAAAAGAPEEEDTAAEAAETLPCPRCKSRETKFCYFNNYNVNQPRHFCKACHRYWTAGGVLRNVPVGAGRRRNPLSPRRKIINDRSVSLHTFLKSTQRALVIISEASVGSGRWFRLVAA